MRTEILGRIGILSDGNIGKGSRKYVLSAVIFNEK